MPSAIPTFLGILTAGTLLAGAAFAAPACEPAKVAEKYPAIAGKTVVFGFDPSIPPYAIIDDKDKTKVSGSDIDLAKAVFDCLGVKYELKPGAWPGLFPAVVSGQIDAMFYLYYTPKRAEQGDFITFMKAGSGAIVQKGNPKNIKAEADLCGKTVSAGLGTVEERQMKTLGEKCVASGKETIQVMTSTDAPSGFRLIATGRADAMVIDLPLINMMVKRNPDVYSVGYSVISDYQIGGAVKNGNPLGPAIADAIQALQASGKVKEIFATYGIDPAVEIPATLKTE
jgi:polar amino acid transport system substrate-binding protein